MNRLLADHFPKFMALALVVSVFSPTIAGLLARMTVGVFFVWCGADQQHVFDIISAMHW